MDSTPKKGMSKGCMVALIIGIALLVIVVALSITCYMKRDSIVKWGTQSALTMVKAEIAKAPAAGVNAEKLGIVVDSFLARVVADPLDYTKYQQFVPVMQKIGADKSIDKAEIAELVDAMVAYYPELELYSVGVIESVDSTTVIDTALVPIDSVSHDSIAKDSASVTP